MAALMFRLLLGLCFASASLAAKVAMIPLFGGSHYIVMAKLGDELATRGHEVAIFVGDSEKAALEKKPHVRVIKLEESLRSTLLAFKPYDPEKKPDLLKALTEVRDLQERYCRAVLDNGDVMAEIKDAEVVIGDSIYFCSSMVAANLSLPLVTIVMSALATPTLHAYGVHNPPAYTHQIFPGIPGKLNFIQRVQSVFGWMVGYMYFRFVFCAPYEEIKEKYNIAPHESFMATIEKIDLIIAQVDFPVEVPRPLLPNTKVVGPLTASPARPLTDDLEEFMRSSGDHGVVLVSFGTIVGSEKIITEKMAAAFSKLPQKVLWKVQRENIRSQLSDNVKTVSWLPQNDILGHSQIKLFFGHGGMNGMLEAVYHGVPMLISPFFGDQPFNAKVAKYHGIAEWVDLKSATVDELVGVMSNVLSNSSYKENSVRLSRLLKRKPRSPVSEAADWVEYLLAVGSFSHLRPRELDLPFYQLYLLDVLFAFLAFLFVMCWVARSLFRCVARRIFGSVRKEKVQ